jgi:hypothetical protein
VRICCYYRMIVFRSACSNVNSVRPRCQIGALCDGVSCGQHGSCSAGSCVCTNGYSGALCEVRQLCFTLERKLSGQTQAVLATSRMIPCDSRCLQRRRLSDSRSMPWRVLRPARQLQRWALRVHRWLHRTQLRGAAAV